MNDKIVEEPKKPVSENAHWLYQNQYCIGTAEIKEENGEKWVKLSDIQHLFSSIKKCD